MDQEELEREFMMQRCGTDRRKARRSAPPYLTAEGLVLVDRREGGDRREPRGDIQKAPARDLVLERVQRLAELYGYQTISIG